MTPKDGSSSESASNTGRSPLIEGALDALVFAPLGLAEVARSDYSALVRAGRQSVRRQTSAARVLGRLAIGQGWGEMDRRGQQIRSAIDALAKPIMEKAGIDPDGGRAPTGRSSKASTKPAERSPGAPGRPGTMPQASELAIPDYDSLAAAQVVQRLAGLSADEVEAVGVYEAATRKRRTILSKTRQLLDAESS